MKRHNEQLKLSDAIKEFVDKNRLQEGLDKVDVKKAWESLMGQGVNHYTKNVILKKNTLYVDLSSSVLREELSYGKKKIIAILNEHLQKELINKIILR
jgi:hypothetical protein